MNQHPTPPGKEPEKPTDEHTPVPVPESPHNTSEGGEFLDDAIRMKDQPLMNKVDKPSTNNEDRVESKCD
jgi:hypothetical protein